MNATLTAVRPPHHAAARDPSTAATWKTQLLHTAIAASAFHLAWCFPVLGSFTLIYAYSLIRLADHPSARVSFRFGLLAGLLVFGPQLAWFWTIFGPAAACLWFVLAFFTGGFVLLLHWWRARFGSKFVWLAAPVIWTGLEFFRGELYFLKFSWLSVGYAFSERAGILPAGLLGVYGAGFLIFLVAASAFRIRGLLIALAILALVTNIPISRSAPAASSSVQVAGIQLEFPPALEIPQHLDRVLQQHPDTQIFVLSEYTFDSSIPKQVRDWCRKNGRYLIAGGKDDSVPGNYYNTAFVVDPTGEIIFKQAKSVPIQFFKDGLPAPAQEVWRSPWGRIAIPVCYDLSYRRVTDEFIRRGAQAFIVPFMDVTDWGAQQHILHTRIAPVRAGEYRAPIFRVGSSGISQHVDSTGQVLATAGYPGQEQIIAGTLRFPKTARLPIDHWLAPACTVLVAALIGFLILARFRDVYFRRASF